ncbi:hypothetical protein P8452_00907 [Trifolium repens]|nr:hypothetical protein P8452_00907 [Trifolium repens]
MDTLNTSRKKGKCQSDRDCYEDYPNAAPGSYTCFKVVRDHYGQRKCHSDRQCYEFQPDAAPGSMTCFKGRCCRIFIIERKHP